MKSSYSPKRVKDIFSFLLTLFLLIKRRDRLWFYSPMSPDELRDTILKLGVSYIKLAQVLATRADFFDDNYLKALKSLHDEIPPMQKEDFDYVYKRAFQDRDIFKEFNPNPIASASIGQVHRATLKNGDRVAIKLRRRGIEKRVKADIKILRFFNRLFSPLFSAQTKNSIDTLIDEFADMLLKEIDLSVELSNLKSFSKTYKDSGVIFPKPYESFCSIDAIVMSFEEGIRFDDKERMQKANIDFYALMDKLIYFYTEQMLLKGYFHADPHPGNLLVRESDGALVLLDYGMLKRISEPTRVAIIEMVKSANEEDYELYISACKRLGIISYDAPMAQMTELAERMFAIFNDDTLDALTMQELAFGVMASMRDFPFKLPQDAIFILRASAIIEGLGTTYIENFNGIKDILPVLQKNIPKALGADKGIFELFKDEFHSLPLRVKQMQNAIQKLSEDELRVHINERQLQWIEQRYQKRLKKERLGWITILLAIIFSLQSNYMVGYTLFALGGAILLY